MSAFAPVEYVIQLKSRKRQFFLQISCTRQKTYRQKEGDLNFHVMWVVQSASVSLNMILTVANLEYCVIFQVSLGTYTHGNCFDGLGPGS